MKDWRLISLRNFLTAIFLAFLATYPPELDVGLTESHYIPSGWIPRINLPDFCGFGEYQGLVGRNMAHSVQRFPLTYADCTGKTHLSAVIANKTQRHHRTLTVFLSYKRPECLSALSALQSLIFQLVSDDRTLRAILCSHFEARRRDLKSSVKFIQEILVTLLKCTGPAYLVIDGLDEADTNERGMLLSELSEVLKGSDKTKILISSRPEHNIATFLKSKAHTIRLDRRNIGCIQSYVMARAHPWLDESGFSEDARSEIKGLLAPLAAKAKGKKACPL
jgi:hypothetical protein